jgi:3-oxoacyl-(acyl-carrier-protein) synthase
VGKCEKIGATIVAFAEPRIVVGAFANDRAAAYVAGRIAYSKSPASDQGGYVFGGGGGVLVALTEKLSLDLGVQAYTAGSGTGSVFQFRGGFALGF